MGNVSDQSQPDDLPTCGKGLASHAPLPRLLGELTAAVAEVLELHRRSLDPSDADARAEDDAYRMIAEQHRVSADQLRDTAARMEACRDLPMGRHELALLADARAREAFAAFVRLEDQLASLLQSRLAADRAILAEMGG